MFLKPAPGRVVPDPERRNTLPTEGRDVVPSQYWQRRLADGDVVIAAPVTAPQVQASGKKKEA